MKKILAISLILLVILLAGCQQTTKKQEKGQVVQVSKSQIKFNIEDAPTTEGKEIEIETNVPETIETVEVGNDWCKEGTNWNFKSSSPDMDASGEWIIKGLMTTGDYKGLCHVEYTMQTPEGETKMDYYFAEDGESGYFEMKMPNGQVIKQEWTG